MLASVFQIVEGEWLTVIALIVVRLDLGHGQQLRRDRAEVKTNRRVVVDSELADSTLAATIHNLRLSGKVAKAIDASIDAGAQVVTVSEELGGGIVYSGVCERSTSEPGLDERWIDARFVREGGDGRVVDIQPVAKRQKSLALGSSLNELPHKFQAQFSTDCSRIFQPGGSGLVDPFVISLAAIGGGGESNAWVASSDGRIGCAHSSRERV